MVASSAFTSAAPSTSAAQAHPVYDLWAPVWRKLVHVYEGSGGFLDGTALIAHPREWLDHSYVTLVDETETASDGTVTTTGRKRKVVTANPNPSKPSAKLLERRRLARYENVAAPIVNHKIAALFRKGPDRRIKGGVGDQVHPWLEWAENVDGAGTTYTDFMRDAWRFAAIFGHSVIVMDRDSDVDNPETKAEQGQPVLRLYTALDMFDWLTDGTGSLTGVRLYEVAPRSGFEESALSAANRYRIRTLTVDTFTVTEETAKATRGTIKAKDVKEVTSGDHGFGVLPVVVLYGKRRALTPVIGDSIIGDPQMHYDLYNLTSEKRELLRKQTFSVLNVPLGTGDQATRLEDAQAMIGESTGTTNVLFSSLPAAFIAADSANVTVYQDECDKLLRTIYRLANVPFESDSKDAEAEGSLKIKRDEMNAVLASYADELQRAEEAINALYFRAEFGAKWEKEWERVSPESKYPEKFDLRPFDEMLQQAQAAVGLDLGRSKTFRAEHSKRLVPEFLPGLPADVADQINKEIDALPDPELERKQEREARLAGMDDAFAAKPGEDEQEPAA